MSIYGRQGIQSFILSVSLLLVLYSDLTWRANSRDTESENETNILFRSGLRLGRLKEAGFDMWQSSKIILLCSRCSFNYELHVSLTLNGHSVILCLKRGDKCSKHSNMIEMDDGIISTGLSHMYAIYCLLHSFMTILTLLQDISGAENLYMYCKFVYVLQM